jgi:hypothetical protein
MTTGRRDRTRRLYEGVANAASKIVMARRVSGTTRIRLELSRRLHKRNDQQQCMRQKGMAFKVQVIP